jgi:uncharacterized protein YdaU (DUF1376 family)
MAEHPYMPFFPEKFFADTLHLQWDARAVYLELLAIAWNRGGSLPNDDRQLRLMIGCNGQKWRALWQEIEPFWKLQEDGRWHQKRLDMEWQRSLEKTRNKWKGASKTPRNVSKKANDSTRAPARALPTTHTHIEEEEALASSPRAHTRARALTRTTPPVYKNSGKGKRNGKDRKLSCSDVIWLRIKQREEREADEREASRESRGGDLRLVSEN